MSYKSDMDFFQKQVQERKKRVGMLIRITVIILAAMILLTAVTAGITFAVGGFDPVDKPDDDAPAKDRKAPVITGPEGDKAIAYLGENIQYKSFVKVSDNSGDVNLKVDNSKVNATVEGTYSVTYTATDAAGNKSEYTMTLIIKKKEYSEDKLMQLVAQKAQELGITKEMSKVEQVRRIYDYVNDPSASKNNANIYFNDESNTPSQQLSRQNWEVDWVEEAVRTLSMSRMEGDCYTYYSVSKAFFEYFEIENYGIQRSAASTEAGTHFWSVVNVGTAQNPRWYYYDATRLGSTFSDGTRNACLITEAKLNSYITSNGGTQFYTFDKWENFPTVETDALS